MRRCLAQAPGDRPTSARAIAAALPGADRLAAALAAGETPLPELVAAAGESQRLSLRLSTVCLCTILIGMIGLAALSKRSQELINFDSSQLIQVDRAQQVIEQLMPDREALQAARVGN